MNIIEAISDNLNEITELSTPYIGRIYVNGTINYNKPIDVRVNRIAIPLKSADLSFIYEKTTRTDNIHKTDAKMYYYYPLGSQFTLADGGTFKVMTYGNIKKYNDILYVDIYCTLVNKDYEIVETLDNAKITSRVKNEMNVIIESNEIIKNLLPQYDYNWLKFSDDDINAIEKFNAMNVLSIIDKLDYEERYYYMQNINSALAQNYVTLPTSVTNSMSEISEISITPFIGAGFLEYHSKYNPRYVFEALIHMYENMLLSDESLYNEFYLVNKIGQKCKISIYKVANTLFFEFATPDESKNNFRLEISDYSTIGDYVKYIIGSVRLFIIDKDTLDEIEVTNVSLNQGDYLKVCTEIISIISASNYEDITLSEYYENIKIMFDEIDTSVQLNDESDGEEEENNE